MAPVAPLMSTLSGNRHFGEVLITGVFLPGSEGSVVSGQSVDQEAFLPTAR